MNPLFTKALQVLCILFVFINQTAKAQKTYSKEFLLISDNDLYVDTYRDRYYTNGLLLQYRYITTNEKIEKQIFSFELGQFMYTPQSPFFIYPEQHDRPYAGYTFGNFSIHKFFKNQTAFKATFEIGLVGPLALAKESQDLIHFIYGFNDVPGWEYQIENALGININFSYLKPLTKKEHNSIDFTSYSIAKIGTTFTEFSTAIVSRVSFLKKGLNKTNNSLLFNSNLNISNTNLKEFFFFIKPQITYALYNATIQGGMFNNNSPITFDIEPLVFELETGIKFTLNRFNLGYSYNYYTKRLERMNQNSNNYGSIQLGYLFN